MNLRAKIPIPLALLRAATGQIGPIGTFGRADSAGYYPGLQGSALERTQTDHMVVREVPIVRHFLGYACAYGISRRWIGLTSLYVRAVLVHFGHYLVLLEEIANENNGLLATQLVQISKNSADMALNSADVPFCAFRLCNGGCCHRGS